MLNEVFTSDFNLDSIFSVQQSWQANDRFNYLDSPRRSHGLFLLTNFPAVFELPDGSELSANAGDVMLLPKGAYYAVRFPQPQEKVSHPIILNFHLTNAEGSENSFHCGVTRLCRDNGTLLPLFAAAAHLYQSASPAKLKSKVYELFGTLFPLFETDECRITYINHHYTDRFSVSQLAKQCAMSETVYRKRFKQLTGLSLIQYINRLKIKKACQMLQSGDISTKGISDFLNFYSLPYFYKVFRNYTGTTPNQYRDNAAGL